MLKIFRYLKESKWSVLAIIVFLVVQAYCDLALPQYTADIVDMDIIEQGSHGELMAKNGFYAELYNSQFEGQGAVETA